MFGMTFTEFFYRGNDHRVGSWVVLLCVVWAHMLHLMDGQGWTIWGEYSYSYSLRSADLLYSSLRWSIQNVCAWECVHIFLALMFSKSAWMPKWPCGLSKHLALVDDEFFGESHGGWYSCVSYCVRMPNFSQQSLTKGESVVLRSVAELTYSCSALKWEYILSLHTHIYTHGW